MNSFVIPYYRPRQDFYLVKNFQVEDTLSTAIDYTCHYISPEQVKLIIKNVDDVRGWSNERVVTIKHNYKAYSYRIPPSSKAELIILLNRSDLDNDYFEPVPHNYNTKIPKIIFQTLKTRRVSEQMYYAIQSILDKNPDYEYYLYDDQDIVAMITQYFDASVVQAYNRLLPGAFKADLWRYCVLFQYGGVYIDAKMIFRKPLHTLMEEHDFISCIDRPKCTILNAFIGVVPKHPFMHQLIQQILTHIEQEYYGTSDLEITGPLLMGTCFKEFIKRDAHKPLIPEIIYFDHQHYSLEIYYKIEKDIKHSARKIMLKDEVIAWLFFKNYYKQGGNRYDRYGKMWKSRIVYYPTTDAHFSKKIFFWIRFFINRCKKVFYTAMPFRKSV
ncbi:MAG: glycosyltransferase [Phycisphaerales bacterium]|nr:glycosyltransferase [Phycisphaerales bacterium]